MKIDRSVVVSAMTEAGARAAALAARHRLDTAVRAAIAAAGAVIERVGPLLASQLAAAVW